MVQVLLESPSYPDYPIHVPNGLDVFDPALVRIARDTYGVYRIVADGAAAKHTATFKRPLGVVVNQVSYRAVLVFKEGLVLLPTEVFIPFNHLETKLY
ncbi:MULTISPECIES: hypothetical protein [unclassified Roseofilum]|uniref:hypothetical protein n=1 Tax=unclassified Roseofilum TaxID=2620099 RepID=UPI000E89F2A8|nr:MULTISPECIES: hypothetical protein [unclassified Roseofilum]MBP0007759.1 hypothetical protein [Roseofilum sp. Belize Diploria]MBP0032152.1 hypothetical protein [Roseofilum sp. Belize BBD 4]HBQ97310.1 hypothetical protein [Cyanobacteria bacterium UBA11691]